MKQQKEEKKEAKRIADAKFMAAFNINL